MTGAACRPVCEHVRKPLLIKAAGVMGRALPQLLPERASFVLLAPRRKHVFAKVQLDQLAQIGFCRIVTAPFPVADGLLRDTYLERNLFLG